MEYLLAVDSVEDTAYQEADKLISQLGKTVQARLIVAGPCQHQSQKLCNIQAGIKVGKIVQRS